MQDDDHGRTPVDPNVTQQVKFDAVCMQFEQAWRQGSQPKIESFSEESPVARPTDRRTDTQIDRYKLLEQVGEGGWVWSTWPSNNGRFAARWR